MISLALRRNNSVHRRIGGRSTRQGRGWTHRPPEGIARTNPQIDVRVLAQSTVSCLVNMRVTISHQRTKQEIIAQVDRSFDQLFGGASGLPVKMIVNQRSWQGDVLTFALTAKLGLMSTPIKGTVEVTEKELTVDADLGMLNNFVSDQAATEMIGARLKGLLNK